MKQLNEQQIVEKWSPMIESTTGLKDKERLNWISKYAHFHALNEAEMGGVTTPYATLYNVPGVGNAVPASQAATTGSQFYATTAKGSGDKWPALLPMSLQVAARTVGFDIVNVVPMPGPTGVVSYLDYVYAGGKQPFGAQPASTPATANPALFQGAAATAKYVAPYAFKLQISDASIKASLTNGGVFTFQNEAASNQLTATYIGKSRIDGFAMFKTGTFTGATNLADIFDGSTRIINDASTQAAVATYPTLISTLEDQVQGFAGSGASDNTAWDGTFVDGTKLYEPMERGVGEMEYPRALGLQLFTKFVQVGTYQVSVSVTQEQIQDLNKQWGIDVIAMVENAGINEISQAINKHILSRVFGLGWKNHLAAYDVEGVNLNLDLTATTASTTTAYAYPAEAGDTTAAMVLNGYKVYPVAGAGFENQDTIIKRVMSLVLAAGNVIMQRGRRGPANFIVTNIKLATAMQTNSQYAFSPLANTFSQNNGSLYPLGTICGMTLYVDPNMIYDDTRILVGRKGANDEPGTIFCPYLMAESVKLITEGTGAPKVIIKSRYALVDAGWHPETQYLTLYVKTNSGAII
ncbi:MAG: hypothetical protein PHF86_01525 [Candidatus Nanoarchaeia archaeon]|nr:hypothetical protein [Candidatus Nanoarchaeia archaeon]